MITKYYICKLESDIVLNSSLNTDGNMSSLDYIPGSNFLGIVASTLYSTNENKETSYEILHSKKVSFGDATISKNGLISYPVPFDFVMDKIEKTIGEDPIYTHHGITERPKKKKSEGLAQLKQLREGYLLSDSSLITEIEKSFSLKSAQDRDTRTSKDGQMFGFDAIQKGQEFVFSIIYQDENYINTVEKHLLGLKRLGKSKNAEFGQVNISPIEIKAAVSSFDANDYILVYAQSNLYFTDEFGAPTLQPKAKDLGLDGEIIWELSQIRSFSYSPWNAKRNTTSTQRHCIAKGSVFYIKTTNKPVSNYQIVGGFQAEGLGRIIYNPSFLACNTSGELSTKITLFTPEKVEKNKKNPTSKLGLFLQKKWDLNKLELNISEKVAKQIEHLRNEHSSLIKISSSQWGGIRAYAAKHKNHSTLETELFGSEKNKNEGYLTHGVAEEKYWGKNGNLKKFRDIFDKNKEFSKTAFVEKFAAEMAKENKRFERKKNGN